MSMIKCSECGQSISDTAVSCPFCGAPQKKNKTYLKRWLVILILMLIILGIVFGVSYTAASPINKKIGEIDNGLISDVSQVIAIKNDYDKLNPLSQIFVFNKSTLSDFSISISPENFMDYFDVEIYLSDYHVMSGTDGLLKTYTSYIDQTIKIQPKTSLTCQDVVVSINPNYLSFFNGQRENIRLNIDGTYSETIELSTGASYVKIEQPEIIDSLLLIESANGFLKF